MCNRELIFVTGYFGASIREEARRIAACKGWPVLDLDQAIEKKDGRSIARLCMMGGEHAYRNAEFEQVEALCRGRLPAAELRMQPAADDSKNALDADPGCAEVAPDSAGLDHTEAPPDLAGLVVACGDGILYDDDTRRLILQHELVITGTDQPLDELWENARQDETTYHAFMKFGTDEEKRAKFEAHHERQRVLFEGLRT